VDIVGPTASTDFPTTRDAFQATNAGALDLAIVQLNRRGRLLFSSYFGGSGEEDSTGVPPALDSRGNLYISGITTSPDFPVTTDAIQPTYGGGDIDGMSSRWPLPVRRGSTISASITAESSFQAGIGLAVPGQPIGPWSR
jgi:hypothetical protein